MVTHEDNIAAYAGRIIHFLDGRIETDHLNGHVTIHKEVSHETK